MHLNRARHSRNRSRKFNSLRRSSELHPDRRRRRRSSPLRNPLRKKQLSHKASPEVAKAKGRSPKSSEECQVKSDK